MDLKALARHSPWEGGSLTKTIFLAMKLTTVILLAACLQASAGAYSQKITLKEKNAPLEKIFHQIKRQSGYEFWYEDNLMQKAAVVDITVQNVPLEQALQLVFRGQPLSYEVIGKTIAVKLKNSPPPGAGDTPLQENNTGVIVPKDIQGVIKNKAGEPLAGVNVEVRTVAGTVRGRTQTDADGKYSIKAEPGDKIMFSFVGFVRKEITIASGEEINIVLEEDVKQLNELQVTALGIKKEERRIGYSLTEVKGTEVQLTREPVFVNALAGKVAGLVVQSPPTGAGGSSRVILRGYSSLNGTNQPLYVIDGVPIVSNTREQNSNDGGKVYGGSDPGDGLATINPDDIETISVLKGASAAALYGSYAQAGVIMITTKKGKKGQGLGISFNSNTVLEKMVPYDERDFQYEYGRGNNNKLYTAADNISGSSYSTGLAWGAKIQGQPFLDVDGKTRAYTAYKPKEQFDHFFKTGLTTTNTVALTSASDNGTYRFSLSQTKNKSPMPGTSGLDRYNGVFRALNDFGKKLHTDVKMDVSRTIRHNIPLLRGDDRGSFSKFFVRTANTTDVRLLDQKDSVGNYLYTYTNPYVDIEKVVNNETWDRVIGSLNVTYDITDHLHAQVQTGIDKTNISGLFAIYPNNKANNAGQLRVTKEERERDNVLGMLSYDNNFHAISLRVNAGAQVDYSRSSLQNITGNNFVDPNLLSLTNVTVDNGGISLYDPRSKTYSVFGAAQLGYHNYLFLELTGRNDWYSTLTFASGKGFDNSLFYPSANLSYVFTDALQMKSKALSFGKFRASWGQTGGNLSPYVTNLVYTIQPLVNTSAGATIYNNTLPPQTVKPEVTTEYEFGTELKFFNNRLGFDLAWYKKTTKDFLVSSNLSSSVGFTSVALNAGSMENKGVEILITGTPVQKKDFSWDVSLNAAWNKNKVLALVPALEKTGISNYYQIKTKVGYAMGSIFGAPLRKGPDGQYVYKAIDTNGDGIADAVVHEKGLVNYDGSGKPIKDANGQTVIDNDAYLGSANPDWTGGITNTFNYKNFSLSFLIDGQFGGYMYNDGYKWASFFGLSKNTVQGRLGDYTPAGVVNTGTDANPVFVKNTLPFNPYQQYNGDGTLKYYADELSVLKKTFIKFRQVSLGYSLPSSLLGKSRIKSVTFSLIARNLFYFKKDTPIFDPQSSDSINNGFGYDSGGLPSSRTYGFNLNLRF